MTGKREMIPQNDLGSPGGKHAALILWMVTELLDRGIRRTSPNELNSAGYLFQEWLGIPTQFSFPMISGAPRNGNLEHLVTGIMFNAKVMDERAEPQSRVMLPGWHASRVLEKHRDFLAQHEPELNLTAGIMDRLEPRERADMNGLIWMILRNPDHGLRDLERSMVGTWGNLRGDPHERFRNACANLRTAWEMARDRGLEPTAEVPSHRENLIQENPDQGPETCRTHGEPYGLESQGHRFHLVKLNGIYWCCWDHTTTLTGASIGPAPAARTPWDTGCPEQ